MILKQINDNLEQVSGTGTNELAFKSNLSAIQATGSTNTTGSQINSGTYFYIDDVLCNALADIAVNATFSLNNNYEAVTVGNEIVTARSLISSAETHISNLDSRVRNNVTARLSNLTTAIAEQNLEKYGYKVGDYFTGASGYVYHIADRDTFYGGYSSYAVVSTHHIGIVVDTGQTSKWNDTADISAVNYSASTLHTYLSGTVLDNIKADMKALFGGSTGLEHLISNQKLYAKIGGWGWSTNAEYISALTEVQMYGCPIWSVDSYQQGEGDKQIDLFRRYKYNAIFGNTSVWLRSICSSSSACAAYDYGLARNSPVTSTYRAAALILFY